MSLIHVTGNTYCIDLGYSYVGLYRIGKNDAVLLDTGRPGEEGDILLNAIRENNIIIKAIISTHAHIDHVGNNSLLKNHFNSTIAMHFNEAGLCFSDLSIKNANPILDLHHAKRFYSNMVCKTDRLILDSDDKITFEGADFSIFHAPGHSPGHICVITPDGVAYLGDALLGKSSLRAAKLPYAFSHSADIKSKEQLRGLKADGYILSHKDILGDISPLIDSGIKKVNDTTTRVFRLIEGEMEFGAILKKAISEFNIRIDSYEKYARVERLFRPFLEYLVETNQVVLYSKDGCLYYSTI
ncbi:MBL fold metallo-hydrolase [Alkalibacter saccharofermentans]|nr:MBL fold metallo-hydrolase [Alkalibacter saccharofermentans]